MPKLTVTFLPSGASVSVKKGTNLVEAAMAADLTLSAPCGGLGRCGKCAVRVQSGVSEPSAAELRRFSADELAEGWRLACQTRLTGPCEVFVPETSLVQKHRIVVDGVGREIEIAPNVEKIALRLAPPTKDDARPDLQRLLDALDDDIVAAPSPELLQSLPGTLRGADYHLTSVVWDRTLLAVEPGDTTHDLYGAAVDIGTTTVVLYLCHLPTGEVVSVVSDLNPQSQWGDDLISRIRMATEEEGGLVALQRAICELIDELLGRAAAAAGVARERIYELTVVGNTCMAHLFLGVSPQGLAALPFAPAFREAQVVRAAELGLHLHPEGRVYVLPLIGGFVGADTVGVIIASELDLADGPRAAVDIGTNGEIVVAKDSELYACSTAAGPAFEGARIRQGMRAAAGAIDAVSVDGEVHYHVIGDAPPRGICGSGLVDAVAGLVQLGVISEAGRLLRPEELPPAAEKVKRRVVQNEAGLEFILATAEETGLGQPVALTARDIRELQLAKGAIFAGISLLLDRLDLRPRHLDSLLLAGAFGNYIRKESAIAIGLTPDLPRDRIHSIGNAAGLGARLALCSRSLRARGEEVARRVQHIELSEQEGFYDHFAEAMALRPLPREE
jgi:uncharacterized 2Fe-2S/4Fe-4S cluster protein (DUF4445 family)